MERDEFILSCRNIHADYFGAGKITCRSPACEPAFSSHSRVRWGHPDWHKFSGVWRRAAGKHTGPLETMVDTIRPLGVESGGAGSEEDAHKHTHRKTI